MLPAFPNATLNLNSNRGISPEKYVILFNTYSMFLPVIIALAVGARLGNFHPE